MGEHDDTQRSNNSEPRPSAKKRGRVFITQIRATGILSSVRRFSQSFLVAVDIDGKNIMESLNKPASRGKDVVEWDEKILLPPDRSLVISFHLYASFEFGPRLGTGESLGQIKTTVGEVLDRTEKLQRKGRDWSLEMTTKRLVCDENECASTLNDTSSDATSELARLTDSGHYSFLRYHEDRNESHLDDAIACFERVHAMCPPDYPHRSTVLHNLATARMILCRASRAHDDLDVPIALYRDALQLRGVDHPDHYATALELSRALLARFKRRRDEGDKTEAKSLLSVIMGSFPERCGSGVVFAALQLEEMETSTGSGSCQMDDELIQKARGVLADLPDFHPDRAALLEDFAMFLYRRFIDFENPGDVQEAILMSEMAVKITPDDDFERPVRLDLLGCLLAHRFGRFGDPADIDRSVSMHEEAVLLTPNDHPKKPVALGNLASVLSRRFDHLGDVADIDASISALEEAVRLTPYNGPEKSGRLSNLASSLSRRFDRLSDVADIDRSISMDEEADRLTPNEDPEKPRILGNIGISLSHRFQHFGDAADMDKSIAILERALCLTPNGDPEMPGRLSNLANALSRRFERVGDVVDIHQSISVLEEAACLAPDDHPKKPAWLGNLACSLSLRFDRLGDVADIDVAISTDEEAVRLTPNGDSRKPVRLNGLARDFLRRFDRLGDVADIDKAIAMNEEAVRLRPDDHPGKPDLLSDLARSLSRRFAHLGDVADINTSISILEEVVRLTSRGDPKMPNRLSNLASALSRRFDYLGDVAGINKSILILEEVVHLTSNGDPEMPGRLSDLAIALSRRFDRLGDVADIDESISMGEEAVRLAPNDDPRKPGWLANMGISLSRRFAHLGDVADIDKSISMHEQAVRLTPDGDPEKPGWLSNLAGSLSLRFDRFGDIGDVDRSISVDQKAVCLTPDGHPSKPSWLGNLAKSLSRRFDRLGDIDDIHNSISILEEAVHLTPDVHTKKPSTLGSLARSLSLRFDRLGDVADIDKSISMLEEAVHLTENGHPGRASLLGQFGFALSLRFDHLSDVADINKSITMCEEAVRLMPEADSSRPGWMGTLATTFSRRFAHFGDVADINKSVSILEEAVHLTPDGHPDKLDLLDNFAIVLSFRFDRLGDVSDINRAISMHEESLRLTPNDHASKPIILRGLGLSLSRRFDHSGDIADINASISMHEEAVRLTPDGHPGKPHRSTLLGEAFMKCHERFRDPSSLVSATHHFSMAARSPTGPTLGRFRAALRWVSCVRLADDPSSVLEPYITIITLLPQLPWLGVPLAERHDVLLDADIAGDAAAAAIDAGQPEMGVEWLENGRSIVWNQLLQLRTPVDDLRVDHPVLAEQFQQTCQELEVVSSRQTTKTEHHLPNDLVSEAPSLEKETQRHHELVLKRDKLLKEIRSLPGFERFLLPRTIEQISTIARSGPVVYLNASKQRCDALIVKAESPGVVLVPLPDVGYQDLEFLLRLLSKGSRGPVISHDDISALVSSPGRPPSQRLLSIVMNREDPNDGRTGEPMEFEQSRPDDWWLRKILKFLWTCVVNPVLSALGFSTPPSRSETMPRVFWCPTGPFAFLPIHAAGLYNDDGSDLGARLSDFAISSYIPTISALEPSTQEDSNGDSLSFPRLRLVAVPQPPNDGQGKLYYVKEEINHIKQLSNTSPFVTFQDSDGTIADVVEKMKTSHWVHFACHGEQDPQRPLDSGLCLADKHRLKLSDIIRLTRPQGGLAFLSACQTAKGDQQLPEEFVHLAAGMLLAGYKGIIATMWAIQDRDAPQVARDVYGHLFRDGKVPDPLEAAEALHCAVRRLRDEPGVSLSSWVPFIHVGK